MQAILNEADSDVEPTKGLPLYAQRHAPTPTLRNNNDLFAIAPPHRHGLRQRQWRRTQRAGRPCVVWHHSRPAASTPTFRSTSCSMPAAAARWRGYAYQYAGPRDAFGNPLGGASVVEGSIEFRQRIFKSFGVVAFVDAAAPISTTGPISRSSRRASAPVWACANYTDFGPARLDFGIPLNPQQNDPPFGIYVSIGQAF